MTATDTCTEEELARVEEIFERIAGDLAMIADRDFSIESIETARMDHRPAGSDLIHISFKMGFEAPNSVEHGCLLVPLPDAISLACYLMMVSDDAVKSKRSSETLDSTSKDAMLEVGNFVSGAADAGLRALGVEDVKVSSEGCQGVKPNIRPALVYAEGTTLVVGRATARLHDFDEFEMILILPEL